MANTRRIGILTGGGDVPGLNSVIKGVVAEAAPLGYEVVGIRRGWMGLIHTPPGAQPDAEYLIRLDPLNTHSIDRTGGTMLHTSRVNPRRVRRGELPAHLDSRRVAAMAVGEDVYDLTPVVLDTIAGLGLHYLIAVGGDDTLSYTRVLDERGVAVVAIPKTMDNDVPGTEYAIGFSTAITRARELINRQRTTLGSHERIGVFRIFGRDAGFTALYAAYVTFSRCLLPECEFDLDRLVATLVDDKRRSPSQYSFVVASEGAVWKGYRASEFGEADAYGHRKKADIGFALAEEIRARTREDAISTDLTYDLRSGEADMLDQMVSLTFASLAMDCIRQGEHGWMAAVRGGRYARVPLPQGPSRRVDAARLYDSEHFCPNYANKLGLPLLLDEVADPA
ncbi:MAG TPA: 6-phosphofructokinase [Candidatus Acidoferrales bacterium]|nr:6-phosphofructokinase [Candidatus Acidoferrales bacterium]